MKNRIHQKYTLTGKQHRKTRFYRKVASRMSKRGIRIYHDYTHVPKDALSWWDDIAIYTRRNKYVVLWRHPRYAFEGKCKDLAYKLVERISGSSQDWLDSAIPQYKKVGKGGRKKLSSYLTETSAADSDYYARWDAQEKEILATTDIVVTPSLSIERVAHGAIYLELVYPIEIRSEEDCFKLAEIVKAMLQKRREGKNPLEEVAAYTYSAEDWKTEQAQREHSGYPDTSQAVK